MPFLARRYAVERGICVILQNAEIEYSESGFPVGKDSFPYFEIVKTLFLSMSDTSLSNFDDVIFSISPLFY
ncbi:hypothetical protein CHR90_12120 [Elstera cyanobacteriorum]|uniref:Uncharacterized protein n=1 Tax=Elstera cyanobacteriorum TaxID=2022747 RepID=A0A255XL93_9PROT|nr:hypothetical protein CHR90_12120 [Elstera cyanobacteriorum]